MIYQWKWVMVIVIILLISFAASFSVRKLDETIDKASCSFKCSNYGTVPHYMKDFGDGKCTCCTDCWEYKSEEGRLVFDCTGTKKNISYCVGITGGNV